MNLRDVLKFIIPNSLFLIPKTMGGVPVKHHSKSKVGKHRAHQALKKVNLVVCVNCKSPMLPHRVCSNCKKYKK